MAIPASGDHDGACSADKTNVLVCKSGRFATAGTCRGPNGCRFDGEGYVCDYSVALVGDRCEDDFTRACSMDHRSRLDCKDGVFVAGDKCARSGGCIKRENVECAPVADAGDACAFENTMVCASDRVHYVVCENGHYVVRGTCAAGCTPYDDKWDCAMK